MSEVSGERISFTALLYCFLRVSQIVSSVRYFFVAVIVIEDNYSNIETKKLNYQIGIYSVHVFIFLRSH